MDTTHDAPVTRRSCPEHNEPLMCPLCVCMWGGFWWEEREKEEGFLGRGFLVAPESPVSGLGLGLLEGKRTPLIHHLALTPSSACVPPGEPEQHLPTPGKFMMSR